MKQKIIILLLMLVTLSGCSWFNKSTQYNVVLTTEWTEGNFGWNALKEMVDQFNKEVLEKDAEKYENRKIVLKNVEINGIDKEVNAGYYGVRKLPNLFISYGDQIVNYVDTLKWHQVDVTVPNLEAFLDKDKILPSYWQETTYNDRLYAVPIGKSIENMFINKKLLLKVFEVAGLSEQAKILQDYEKKFHKREISSKNFPWKDGIINWSHLESEITILKKINSWEKLKKSISTWDSFLALMKITSYFFKNLNNLGDNEIYSYAIDDLPNSLYAWYGNEEALNYGRRKKNFLFYENEEQKFTLNLKGDSQRYLSEFLSNVQELKRLAPRKASDIRRITGYHVKVPNSTSLRGTYSSTLFKNDRALAAVGSTSGLQFFLAKDGNSKGLQPEDILVLPLPFKTLPTKVIQQGPGLSMFKTAEPIKNNIAEEFIKYMLKKENNEKYAFLSGYFPVNKESYTLDSWYGEQIHKSDKNYLRLLKNTWEMIKNSEKNIFYSDALEWPEKSMAPVSPPLIKNGIFFRRTLLKTLNIFYQDLVKSSYRNREMTIAEFFGLLKQQLIDDGIKDLVINE